MKWHTQAPANIALIKYMGKKDVEHNIPCNASLSYASEKFLSFVELETSHDSIDHWEPLPAFEKLSLTPEAQQRFISHLMMIKKRFHYTGHFIIRSANNFPAACGLASSASSFAALTLCAVKALSELTHKPHLDLETIAQLSQLGSGSSCRSIMTPWTRWSSDKIERMHFPDETLLHYVVVVDSHEKKITSRMAHQRVIHSALFEGRSKRAELRLQALIHAFNHQDWKKAFLISWQEFWDMHALFETCDEPFTYMTPASLNVLNTVKKYWQQHQDGPLMTMDAGPNVHLLFRENQHRIAADLTQLLMAHYNVL